METLVGWLIPLMDWGLLYLILRGGRLVFSSNLLAWLTELSVKLYCIAGGTDWLDREALEEPAVIMAGSLRLLKVMLPSTCMSSESKAKLVEEAEARVSLPSS